MTIVNLAHGASGSAASMAPHVEGLEKRGVRARAIQLPVRKAEEAIGAYRSQVQDLEQAAVLCAMLYFEHVARNGPLLNILMTDLYMAGRLDPKVRQSCDLVAERLTRLADTQLPCSPDEIHAAIEMMSAIPDEAGRLVFHRELDQTTARQICNGLIASSLKALRAPEKVSIPD